MHIERQFYEGSKSIIKTYANNFLSQSDREDIDRLVCKSRTTSPLKQTQVDIQPIISTHNTSNVKNIIKHQQEEGSQFRPEKHLIANIQNKKKLVFKIVKLFHDFFRDQKSQNKAQEIMHIYKKKLCDETIIVPTLFCWLNDWISKQFSAFIKKQISQLSYHNTGTEQNKKQKAFSPIKLPKNQIQEHASIVSSNSIVFEPPTQKRKKNRRNLKKQINPDIFFSIDLSYNKSKQDLHEKIQKITLMKKENVNEISESKLFQQLKSMKKQLGLGQQMLQTIDRSKENDDRYCSKEVSKDKRRLSINSYEFSNLVPVRQEPIVEQLLKKQTINNTDVDFLPINKQILIGAFHEKYLSLYKSLEPILLDLDIQYIKQIKRNDRKTEVKKRIKQISRILTRNQPFIKQSVEQYQIAYFQRKRRLHKQLRRKKNRQKKSRDQQIDDPESDTATRYNSLDVPNQTIQLKITSEKKLSSNLLLKKQITEETNLQKIYQRRREQKPKQGFALNRPTKFEFNLPVLPQKQRTTQNRIKEPSKIVLIQSGRYKLLDYMETNDILQMTNRKKKLNSHSMDLGELTPQNTSPIINRQSYSRKKIAQPDKRTVSILQIITKKKKNIQQENFQQNRLQSIDEVALTQVKRSNKKNYDKKSLKQNEQANRQFKNILQSLQASDYDITISGWEKGEETPQIQ